MGIQERDAAGNIIEAYGALVRSEELCSRTFCVHYFSYTNVVAVHKEQGRFQGFSQDLLWTHCRASKWLLMLHLNAGVISSDEAVKLRKRNSQEGEFPRFQWMVPRKNLLKAMQLLEFLY